MCWPVAQASISLGEALLVRMSEDEVAHLHLAGAAAAALRRTCRDCDLAPIEADEFDLLAVRLVCTTRRRSRRSSGNNQQPWSQFHELDCNVGLESDLSSTYRFRSIG